ncbi:MAG: hypothetical protein KKH04_13375 [Proteobacteria bacterium]|nr:hypothetical protein [Pseudomonadota bacterium]
MSTIKRIQYFFGVTLLNFVLFGIVPNLISDHFRQNLPIGVVFVAVMAVSYFILRLVINYFENRSRVQLTLVQKENPSPRRGLIVLMSPGPRTTAAENAVKAHLSNLEHCWVIHGPDRPGQKPTSRENAEVLAQKIKSIKNPVAFYFKGLADEDNPQEIYYLVRSVYEEAKAFNLSEEDVIADYTGGTKSMTAGMVLACSVSEQRDAEYMKPVKTTPSGVAEPGTEAVPVLVDLKFGSQVQ